ncbi:MAG: response regulator [Myxococcota bacterium]|nr:response regulator [Myxococcota bacterium]
MKVLVVDDDRDARDILRYMLEEHGAQVVTAENAGAALIALRVERPDLLLSDIGMPGVDGYELMRRIRQLGPDEGGRVPAAAISAFARSEDRRRALMAGYQMHLSKPVEPAELRAVCASLADRS